MSIMNELMQRERTVFIVLTLLLAFLLINFNQTLAMIYLFFIVLEFIIFTTDKNPELNTERRTDNRGIAVLIGVATYIAFSFAINHFIPFKQSLAASTPIFANSIVLSIIAWGVLVPIIETKYFVRIFEFLSEKLGMGLKGIGVIFLMAIVSIAFMLFHLTAKGITNTNSLIITFAFMFISLILVLWTKEMKSAIVFHVVNNFFAVYYAFH